LHAEAADVLIQQVVDAAAGNSASVSATFDFCKVFSNTVFPAHLCVMGPSVQAVARMNKEVRICAAAWFHRISLPPNSGQYLIL